MSIWQNWEGEEKRIPGLIESWLRAGRIGPFKTTRLIRWGKPMWKESRSFLGWPKRLPCAYFAPKPFPGDVTD